MAEISVPAWPMPIHQTKLTMSQAHMTGCMLPQTPTPVGGLVPTQMPQAPHWSFNAVARYEWPMFGGMMSAEADAKWNSYQYLETGILLAVTPRINSGGLVTLEVNQEVSEPLAQAAGSTNSNPDVATRNAKTSVVVASGESIVLAGLGMT